jgi:ribosomal protein L16/L10AE
MQERTPTILVNKKKHKIKRMKGLKGLLLNRYSCGMKLLQNKYLKFKQFMTARLVISRTYNEKKSFNTRNLKLIKSRIKTDPDYHGSHLQYAQIARICIDEEPKSSKKGLIYLRSTIDKPLTKKPIQVRMGKGKGAIQSYIYPARRHRVFIELTRRKKDLNKTKQLALRAGHKISPFSKFIFDKNKIRRECYSFRLLPKFYFHSHIYKAFLSPIYVKRKKVEDRSYAALNDSITTVNDKINSKIDNEDFLDDTVRLFYLLDIRF